MSAWLEPKRSEIPFDVLIRVRTYKGQQRAVKRIKRTSKNQEVTFGNGRKEWMRKGENSAYVTVEHPFEVFYHGDIASWRR